MTTSTTAAAPTIRLTITLDIPKETFSRALADLTEIPCSEEGVTSMLHHFLTDENRRGLTVGPEFLAAIVDIQPQVMRDYNRLGQLHPHYQKWERNFKCGEMTNAELEAVTEYVTIQVKYKPQPEQAWHQDWKTRLEMVTRELALRSAQV